MRPLSKPVLRYLKTAATPLCLELLRKWEAGDMKALVETKISPLCYSNAEHYLTDAQALAFFSKNADVEAEIDTRKQAWESWRAGELRCAVTNQNLKAWVEGECPNHFMLNVREFLADVKRQVSWWLPPVPRDLTPRFGPGSTKCCRGHLATVPDKMSKTPTLTPRLLDTIRPFFEGTAWCRALLDSGDLYYRDGVLSGFNTVTCSDWWSVTKTALTDRSIEIGPSLNVSYQLALGREFKRSFARKGWDLVEQPDTHKLLAQLGSLTEKWATIDLKNASDSVSRALVRYVTPSLTYELLEDLRVPSMSYQGQVYRIEKFSGMGNGFTFELESVIFMSICQVVLRRLGLPAKAGRDVFVFGDDIIVDSSAASEVISALRLVGFETNVTKTFVEGPFRESCGGDFFRGEAVRPFFLDKFPREPQEWIAMANGLRRAGTCYRGDFLHRDAFRNAWAAVLDCIPSRIRECRGPEGLGDIVIHDSDQSSWITRTIDCIRYVRTYSPVVNPKGQRRGGSVVEWDNFRDSVKLASVLADVGDSPMGRRNTDIGVIPRRPINTSFKHAWVSYS